MNVGNIDIEATEQSVTLRLRHVVAGHPGAVLAHDEARDLIGRLQTILDRPKPAAVDALEDLFQ